MPISVPRTHFALRYEVPKFLPRGGHLCMAMLTITKDYREIARENRTVSIILTYRSEHARRVHE